MKKKFMAMTLGLVMALSLVACGGGSDSGSSTTKETAAAESGDSTNTGSNTVVVAMGAGFSTLDPGYTYEKYPPVIINACYETLFKFYDNEGAAEPCLVDTYEFSGDAMTLTVTLKDGITFASGNPMTSADVLFSINRCKNLQGNPSFICDTIESMEAPDEKTVVFHLTQPDSAVLSKLTYSATAILDSEVVKANGGTDAEDAAATDTAQAYLDTTSAGSGMYVMTSYTPDEEVVLEKNPNYWGEATNVDKYIIKIQPDSNTQMMTLSTGDIDVAMNMTDDTMAELAGAENVEIINGATKTVGFVMMNMNEEYGGPVSDPNVQKAIRKAIDYTGIQTIIGEGTLTPYSIIQSGFMGSKGERDADYTNLEEAKALLAEAGYPDGFDVDLTVCDLDMEGVVLTDLAQKVKDDLSQIGINVNIVSQPWAAGYGDDYRDGKLGFTVMYWGVDYNDPNAQLEFLPGASVGLRAGWTAEMAPELAGLYQEAMKATDNDARIVVLEQIQDMTYEDGPFIMIAQAPAHIGYNTRLEGVAISDPYALDLTLIHIK
ncbi:ABC transporter substrate-binding protein [Frisingicoccus caecimuris]|uniref:Peptide/nickel transport system substrate-binding protein n=1 Tax=Frisingicoccus caecimuris TaxID=1796636 RepID=A0A4R2LG96_9FIRM|nr:ABC transporter substrate-binding protein [Frisingicoccus caecimuris]MCR1919554.1 ABC transporter substrate-binding protein [Frisingicoccus caecimuris]TCO83883.1 peptide/nickel transport system substrate-binding protein [Frisingicoccus caecimuris]